MQTLGSRADTPPFLLVGTDAKYDAGGVDEWVSMSFQEPDSGANGAAPANPLNAFACTYGIDGATAVQACSFSLNTTTISTTATTVSNASSTVARGGSCTFLLPAHRTLVCTVTAGAMHFNTAGSRSLASSVYGTHAAPLGANYTCPDPPSSMYPDRHGKNPCNCAWRNPSSTTDVAVAINALSVDDGYNNFFCYTQVQQASFGVNSNNRNDGGSAFFILGAGESLTCEMQYGFLAWPSVTVIAMTGSIFAKPGDVRDLVATKAARRLPPAGVNAPLRSPNDAHYTEAGVAHLWAEWMVLHGKMYPKPEEQQRFSNFKRAVALADLQAAKGFVGAGKGNGKGKGRTGMPTMPNSLADLSLEEFGEKYHGCNLAMSTEEWGALAKAPAHLLTAAEVRVQTICFSCGVPWQTQIIL